MNLATYNRLAMAFAKMQPTAQADMIHAALGITSDMGELMECLANHQLGGNELDRTNFLEETGDSLWYANLMANSLNSNLPSLHIAAIEAFPANSSLGIAELQTWITISSCRIADHIKAHVIYGKELAVQKIECELGLLAMNIEILAAAFHISLGQILHANIAKLSARYAGKYDASRALDRNKEAERDAIQKAAA